MLFVECDDAIQVWPFALVVQDAEIVRALEKHVLQVMGDAGGFRRIVFASGADGDFGVETRLLAVFAEVCEETVVEFEYVDLHGIGRVRALHQSVVGVEGKGAYQQAQ